MTSDKNKRQKSRLRYIVFLKKYKWGNLNHLGRNASDKEIMEADGSTMRLVNHKSGHKSFFIQHETNGNHTKTSWEY